jgi:hypothetical protein
MPRSPPGPRDPCFPCHQNQGTLFCTPPGSRKPCFPCLARPRDHGNPVSHGSPVFHASLAPGTTGPLFSMPPEPGNPVLHAAGTTETLVSMPRTPPGPLFPMPRTPLGPQKFCFLCLQDHGNHVSHASHAPGTTETLFSIPRSTRDRGNHVFRARCAVGVVVRACVCVAPPKPTGGGGARWGLCSVCVRLCGSTVEVDGLGGRDCNGGGGGGHWKMRGREGVGTKSP